MGCLYKCWQRKRFTAVSFNCYHFNYSIKELPRYVSPFLRRRDCPGVYTKQNQGAIISTSMRHMWLLYLYAKFRGLICYQLGHEIYSDHCWSVCSHVRRYQTWRKIRQKQYDKKFKRRFGDFNIYIMNISFEMVVILTQKQLQKQKSLAYLVESNLHANPRPFSWLT